MRDWRIVCEDAVEENDILYFPRFHGRGFYSYNKTTKETKILGNFENDDTANMRLFKSTIKVGQNLIFGALNGRAQIAIFNLENNTIKYICLEEYLAKNGYKSDRSKFCDCIAYSDYVYFICHSFPSIVRLNIKDYSVKFIDEWRIMLGNDAKFNFSCCYRKDNLLLLCCQETPNMVMFDLETEKYEIVQFDVDAEALAGVVSGVNNDYWLFSRYEPYAYNLDSDGKLLNKIKLFEPMEVNRLSYLSFPYTFGNGCYLFPVSARNIYYLDFNTYKCEICNEFAEIVSSEFDNNPSGRLLNFQTRDNYVYVVEVNSRLWHEISLVDKSFNTYDVFQDKRLLLSEFKHVVREGEKRNLSHLIKVINDRK